MPIKMRHFCLVVVWGLTLVLGTPLHPQITMAQNGARDSVQYESAASPGTYWVTNPTSGARLFCTVVAPDGCRETRYPTLILVPGGSDYSRAFLESRPVARALSEEGIVAVVFDPDGRGRSQGTEDYDGFTQQDGLKAVIQFAEQLPCVDTGKIGLVSASFGITMASGVLARYPDLPVKFLIDWEGPADRNDTGGCDEYNTGHIKGVACDNATFWRQREAATFIKMVTVPYQRLQSQKDHAQPDLDHAITMVNSATSKGYGGLGLAPWTRLNRLTPNTTYSQDDPPEMLPEPEGNDFLHLIIDYSKELFGLFGVDEGATTLTGVTITLGGDYALDSSERRLLGVISGPIQPKDSGISDLTQHLNDIGVDTIRNNDYYDDRMDIEGIFNCGGLQYPSWEGCDPEDDKNYNWGPSDELFESWLEGGFEPFLRLGGEYQNRDRNHDFKGPQNRVQEANWIVAGAKVVERYLHWDGADSTFEYLDIWTEFPTTHFWDRTNEEFYAFWARAYQSLKAEFPGLKIGGPGFVAGESVHVVAGNSRAARGLLEHLSKNEITPDWIGWHLFYNEPIMFYVAPRAYRDLLDGAGIYSDVPWAGTGIFDGVELICDAYGLDKMGLAPKELFELYNGGHGAAIRTASWIALKYSDTKRAYLYRAGDPSTDPDSAMEDDMRGNYTGLFYGDETGAYKPSANAFRLWSEVERNFTTLLQVPIPPTQATGGLWVLGARDEDGRVALLVSNPTEKVITWSPQFESGKAISSYHMKYYVVDQEADGRTPKSVSGDGEIEIGPNSVELLIMSPVPDILAQFNGETFTPGERLEFSVSAKSVPTTIDLYVAILLPSGVFYTFTSAPFSISSPNEIIPYLSGVTAPEEFAVLDLEVPAGIGGEYMGCVVATGPGSDPWQIANWLNWHCTSIMISD